MNAKILKEILVVKVDGPLTLVANTSCCVDLFGKRWFVQRFENGIATLAICHADGENGGEGAVE